MTAPNDNLIIDILTSIDRFFIKNNSIEGNISMLIETLLTIIGSYMFCWIMYRGAKVATM